MVKFYISEQYILLVFSMKYNFSNQMKDNLKETTDLATTNLKDTLKWFNFG